MNTLNARIVPNPFQDVVLLGARVVLGVVLVAHGWQKHQDGITATAEGFGGLGIPMPELAAWFSTYVELGGGVLMILGLLTPLVGLLVAGTMGGAFWYVHRSDPVVGGWELVGVIGLLALALAAVGPGRLSLDHLLTHRRGASAERERDLVGA